MQIERVRLNYKSASMRRPSREQEVLHYQWFADLGSVEAQRAVGQIFSHGTMRNPEQALRYFRYSYHAALVLDHSLPSSGFKQVEVLLHPKAKIALLWGPTICVCSQAAACTAVCRPTPDSQHSLPLPTSTIQGMTMIAFSLWRSPYYDRI